MGVWQAWRRSSKSLCHLCRISVKCPSHASRCCSKPCRSRSKRICASIRPLTASFSRSLALPTACCALPASSTRWRSHALRLASACAPAAAASCVASWLRWCSAVACSTCAAASTWQLFSFSSWHPHAMKLITLITAYHTLMRIPLAHTHTHTHTHAHTHAHTSTWSQEIKESREAIKAIQSQNLLWCRICTAGNQGP